MRRDQSANSQRTSLHQARGPGPICSQTYGALTWKNRVAAIFSLFLPTRLGEPFRHRSHNRINGIAQVAHGFVVGNIKCCSGGNMLVDFAHRDVNSANRHVLPIVRECVAICWGSPTWTTGLVVCGTRSALPSTHLKLVMYPSTARHCVEPSSLQDHADRSNRTVHRRPVWIVLFAAILVLSAGVSSAQAPPSRQ